MKNGKWNTGGVKLKDITAQCTFSWDTAPTSITAGTFPDSFLDKNPETKLEFYSTYSGANTQATLYIDLPKICFFALLGDVGLGAQIGGDGDAVRELYATQGLSAQNIDQWVFWKRSRLTNIFSERLLRYKSGLLVDYGDRSILQWYSNTSGSFAFEIFNIRILEFVGLSL